MSDIDTQIKEFEQLEDEIDFWERFQLQVTGDVKKASIVQRLDMLKGKQDKIMRSVCREN